MTASDTNPYLRTQVETATPAELRLMLLDGAIKFLEQGRAGLAEQDYEAAYNGVSRCQNILLELINSLDPTQSPEVCEKLSGLYTFMYTRLVDATTERDPEIADEVLKLLAYERETWVLLMDQLAEENMAAAESATEIAKIAASAENHAPPGPPSDIVGGQLSIQG